MPTPKGASTGAKGTSSMSQAISNPNVVSRRITCPAIASAFGLLAISACDADLGSADDEAEREESHEMASSDMGDDVGRRLSAPESRKFAPNQAIVRFRAGVSETRRREVMLMTGLRARPARELGTGATLWSIAFDPPMTFTSIAEEEERTLVALAALREHPEVEYAHEDVYMRYFAVPNDPLFGQQWHYTSARFPGAWDTTVGSPGVTIAVLDSGRLDHPDFAGRWTAGYNAVTGSTDAYDHGTWHHGLAVAGILGVRTNNGAGIAGTCWNCPLMPVRVSDNSDTVVMSSVEDGIMWAANNGARVINMSFGTDAYGETNCANYTDLQIALNFAASKGIVLVAAAGNDGGNTAQVSPAGCNGVLAVGATTTADQHAPWSNKGKRVDVVAPGGTLDPVGGFYGALVGCPPHPWPASGTAGVLSSWATPKPKSKLLPSDYCHRYLTGTSLSAPHVAGLAALLLSKHPGLTPGQVAARIKQSARPIAGCDEDCGAGLIDAAAALAGKPSPLYGIRKAGVTNTELHVLADGFDEFLMHQNTALHVTGSDLRYEFGLGDYDGDGTVDLYLIDKMGATKQTNIHILNGSDNFQSYLLHRVTALHETGTNGQWEFELGDYDLDGVLDLYAINKIGATGHTNVHILGGSDNFQSFILHSATALHSTGVDQQWKFELGDYDGDGALDLYAINKMGASAHTNVHILGGGDDFQSFLLHRATALHSTGTNGQWEFELGDYDDDGALDLYARPMFTSSGGAAGASRPGCCTRPRRCRRLALTTGSPSYCAGSVTN